MKEYMFSIKKEENYYVIGDADEEQNLFSSHQMMLPLGGLVSFYQKLAAFCQEECIMGNSIYGNARDLPYVYAVLRDKACIKEANSNIFDICKNNRNDFLYEVWHLVLDGPTTKYQFPRKALHDLCYALFQFLKHCADAKIKVWADYVLNKMTEDVPLNYELFCKWLEYTHKDLPDCYYEVYFDAYENVDEHLTLRQNMEIAAQYVKEHEHDYD